MCALAECADASEVRTSVPVSQVDQVLPQTSARGFSTTKSSHEHEPLNSEQPDRTGEALLAVILCATWGTAYAGHWPRACALGRGIRVGAFAFRVVGLSSRSWVRFRLWLPSLTCLLQEVFRPFVQHVARLGKVTASRLLVRSALKGCSLGPGAKTNSIPATRSKHRAQLSLCWACSFVSLVHVTQYLHKSLKPRLTE